MQVDALPLAERYVAHFEAQGIAELYPPQAAAVEAGVCEGASVVAAVPTASGKTLIAQLAALTADGPAVYVVPLRALATEKADTFGALPGVSVGVATGDFDAADEDLADEDVVVATAEKVDAAIRHDAAWVRAVECAVLDEVHLLDDASRGPTLEVTIAKLRRLNPDVQLVALSATVPNADDVADWLDAEVVHSEWRPVDLRTGVAAGGSVHWSDGDGADDARRADSGSGDADVEDADGEAGAEDATGGDDAAEPDDAADGDDATEADDGADADGAGDGDDELSATARLVEETLAAGGQCLVFVSSRRDARSLATELAGTLDAPLLPERTDAGSDARSDVEDALANGGARAAGDDASESPTARIEGALRDTARTRTGEALASVAADGVAFHHAGLRGEHRRIVETGFRNGELGVCCATPTLAAGVNVPARRVVVRDHRRYGDAGYEPLSTLEVHQMFGRAGRPGLDPYGEAILVAEDDEEREELAGRYLDGSPDPVTSALDDPGALRPHVLASVATGMVASRDDLAALLDETFCAHRAGDDDGGGRDDDGGGSTLHAHAEATVDRLLDAGMLIERQAGDGVVLEATELGRLVSQVYVDPETGADVVAALRRADDLERVTALTVCEIVCDTAEMPRRYVGQDEEGGLVEFARRRGGELATSIDDVDGEFRDWLASLKTARLLADYARGEPLADLVDGYAVGPGDVRRYAERAEWLLAATESLAEYVGSDATAEIRETREQLAERGA